VLVYRIEPEKIIRHFVPLSGALRLSNVVSLLCLSAVSFVSRPARFASGGKIPRRTGLGRHRTVSFRSEMCVSTLNNAQEEKNPTTFSKIFCILT
jgi:hypothetical protein